MRKTLFLLGTALAGLGLAAPAALADVTVTATITKDKVVTVDETIFIDKFVDILAFVDVFPEKAAESMAIVNQTNRNNEACTSCDEKTDELIDSSNMNSGIISTNQAGGNNNNQGNVVSAALDARVVTNGGGEGEDSGFAEAQSSVDQRNGGDGEGNLVDSVNLLFRNALIQGSVNDNSGVVHVNQAPGNMNNQANALSLAVSLLSDAEGDAVALSEDDLGQENSFNQNFESSDGSILGALVGIQKNATISGSISGNTGIVGVNQAAGNMANQANSVSLAAVVPGGA